MLYACREALDDLVRLGFHYRQLQRFVQQEQQPCSRLSRSLYRQALCAGLAGAHSSCSAQLPLICTGALHQSLWSVAGLRLSFSRCA